MKRRSFIIASILGFLGVSVLSFFRWAGRSNQNTILAQPKFLSLLCDENTIRMLGRSYLKMNPAESKDHLLLGGLLIEKSPSLITEKQEMSLIESRIEKRIVHDFDTDNIIVVEGWVLSVTEARQCAFFSMLNN